MRDKIQEGEHNKARVRRDSWIEVDAKGRCVATPLSRCRAGKAEERRLRERGSLTRRCGLRTARHEAKACARRDFGQRAGDAQKAKIVYPRIGFWSRALQPY